MEFLKLIYLSLIKKPKKKEEASFPISLECFVFFFSLGQFCSSKLCYTHSEGHAEAKPRAH